MSYILDALKKSEQERKKSEIPTVFSTHAEQTGPRKMSRPVLHYWVVPVLFGLSLAVFGWWQWPKYFAVIKPAETPLTPPSTTAPQQPSDPTRQEKAPSPSAGLPATSTQLPPQMQEPAAPPPQQSTAQTAPAAEVVVPVRTAPEPTVIQPAPLVPATETVERRQVRAHPAARPSEIPVLEQLPEATQKKIPTISMAGHVFAEEPARRMIMINNRIVREGEMAGDNLKLLRINWDGVVLRHESTEFQMKLK